jgi:AraC-like DNA-binding protein
MLTSFAEVLWTARYDYQPHWNLASHKHDYFQMIYFISGSGCFNLAGREYSISPDSLFLVKPNLAHALSPSSIVKTLDIKFHVNDRRIRNLMLAADDQFAGNEPGIPDLFERIRHEGGRRAYLYQEICGALLVELLLLYLRNTKARDVKERHSGLTKHEMSDDWIVQQALQFIWEHYSTDCNLLEIARVVGRSDKQVRRHFRDALGMSPRRYLLQYRIQKAQEQIEYSNYSLKEIADRVGFKTIHHFTRAFHESCGETPGGWRSKYQAGICKDVNIDPQFVNRNWIVKSPSLDDAVVS